MIRSESRGAEERSHAWRTGRRRARLAALVALVAPLLSSGWGRPGLLDPSPDAPWPLRSLLAVERWPAGELPPDKYPEGWHLLVGAAQQVAVAVALDEAEAQRLARIRESVGEAVAQRRDDPAFDPSCRLQVEGAGFEAAAWRLVVAGRIVALAMLVVLVLAAAEVAMAAAGPAFGWVGALAIGLQPGVAHYAATLNTDVPALAWSALAWALLVAARRPAGRARLAAAGAALGLAAATKDQYAAMAPGIACFAWFAPFRWCGAAQGGGGARDAGAPAGVGRVARLGWLALGGSLAYAATSGLLAWPTWRGHVEHLFGAGSQPFREHDLSPGGIAGTLRDAGDALLAAAGVAGGGALVLLLLIAGMRRRWRALFWLLPGVSYAAGFLLPAGYVYPRFALPIALCCAVALAWAFARAPGATRRQRLVVAALALLYLAAEASQVVQSKWSDPRPASVAELERRRAPGEEVWICSEPWLYAPFPPIPGPVRPRELKEMAAAVRDGEAPPRWLWFAAERTNPILAADAIASIEKRLHVQLVARFDPAPSGRLATDPAGLLLPTVLLFHR